MKNFRKTHILNILKTFEKIRCPLDLFLSKYFREKKSIGSKDRKIIAEKIYKLIRWRGLIDYFAEKPISFENRLKALDEINFEKVLKDPKIPPHIRGDFIHRKSRITNQESRISILPYDAIRHFRAIAVVAE